MTASYMPLVHLWPSGDQLRACRVPWNATTAEVVASAHAKNDVRRLRNKRKAMRRKLRGAS